jgi:hypothetical protein
MTVFSKSLDHGIHVAQIYQNDVLTAGSAPYASILSFNDELRTGIQSSSSIVYSCAVPVVENSFKV